MKVKSQSEVAQSCLTPSDPMDCSPLGSSIHGIFQARVLEWGATAFYPTLRQFPKNTDKKIRKTASDRSILLFILPEEKSILNGFFQGITLYKQ